MSKRDDRFSLRRFYPKGQERSRLPVAGLSASDYLHMKSLIRAIQQSAIYARGRLLDLGCGNKPFREFFVNRVTDYFGVDMEAMTSKPDIVAHVSHLPFGDASFDTVLTTQVAEHVSDPNGMMKEIGRILRPGGYLILSAPMAWQLHGAPHDYFRFTRYGLADLARRSGLSPLMIQAQGGAWALAGQVICSILSERRLFMFMLPMNLLFSFMDRIWYDQSHTTNHIMVARR